MIKVEVIAKTKYKEWYLMSAAFDEFRAKYKKLQINVGYELINGGGFYLTAKCEGYLSPDDTLIKTLVEDFEEIKYFGHETQMQIITDLQDSGSIDEEVERLQSKIDFLKEIKTNSTKWISQNLSTQ